MRLDNLCVRFASWTLWDYPSDKAMCISFGRDFRGFAAMWDCPLWASGQSGSAQVIMALLGATTVQVGAIAVLIARYLFPGRQP
jgi:hypothetical protein